MELISSYLKSACTNNYEMQVSLRGARILSGYSAQQVAKSLGISPSLLYQYERNPDAVLPTTARKLAKVYKMPIDAITFVSQ